MPGLLATKLHRPSIPAKWVRRPRLVQRLNEGLELNRQITLASAPAGFGKTTCICEWVDGLDRSPVAWLSLEPADDDPGRFFTYFVAALQEVDPSLGREIEAVLRSGQLPPGEIISAALINDILVSEGRFLLVLDDFHAIQDRFILQVFEQLVANFPYPLHLVLITREDPPLPLARMRANNQLTEIRARDLRFSRRDIDRFLNEVMGLSLSPPDIARLEDKTEGWIVGLQLAAIAVITTQSQQSPLSVRDREDPSSFIASLSGSHRYILGYLTEQVLSRQPGEIRHFLLETSILDRLNGDLCSAVIGRTDGRAMLERLFNANLFLIPLDDEGQWYRYHHLFAGLLRNLQNDLQEDKTAELHRRASRWYARAGMASEAIQHALAAKDFPVAVELLESHALNMIMQGYAKTVDGWVRSIPEKWEAQRPRTNLAFAWAHLLRGAYSQALQYLERLQATFMESPLGSERRNIIYQICRARPVKMISRERRSSMIRILFGVFIVLHGMVHLLYFGQSARYFELQPGMVWPDGSWAFSRLLGNAATRNLASILLILAAVGFMAGGASIFLKQAWWRPAVASVAVFSSAIYILFWDGGLQHLDNKGGIGILINLAILAALLIFQWPDFEF